MTVELDGNNLTIEDIVAVARNGEEVAISGDAEKKVRECRERLEERMEEGDKIYGVNTGLGALADKKIEEGQLLDMQDNILKATRWRRRADERRRGQSNAPTPP